MPFRSTARLLIVPLLAAALSGAAPAPSTSPAAAPAITGKLGAPVALFNGKDLTGWKWTGSAPSKIEDVWTVKDGVLRSGTKPTGYIATEKEYKNFVLTAEYRHITKLNGGIFVCISGEEKVWPNALQVQAKFGSVGDLINQNKGLKAMTTAPGTKAATLSRASSRAARKPSSPVLRGSGRLRL